MSKRLLFTALAALVSFSSLTAAETAKATADTKPAAKSDEAAEKAPRLTIVEPMQPFMTQAMLDVARVLTPEQRARLGERMRDRQARMEDRMKRMESMRQGMLPRR